MTGPDNTTTPTIPPPRRPGLLRSSAQVGLMTAISRVLGLARDIVLASTLGASALTDAFFVAFRIPNFFRRLFAEGAFSQAFVPVLAEYREKRSAAETLLLLNAVTGVLGSVLLLVTVLAIAGAPWLTWLFAPGFADTPAVFDLTVQMLRITFPYLLLISLAGLAGAVLNSYGRFGVPAFTPVWMNICMIIGALLGARYSTQPVIVLAWAVMLSGVVQLAFQMPFLARISRLPTQPRVDFRHEGVRRILTLMGPAIFGVSVSQINLLVNTMLASFLPVGSITWLYYSDRLTELPLGIFGIAIATVVLPSLSRNHAVASTDVFSETLAWAVRTVLVIALPATLALVLLAEPIIATLFQYNRTTPHDVLMAAWSLRAYALGLVGFMLIKVLAPGFYARQDTATPVKIGIQAMAANMVLNLLLVYPLHALFSLGHMGLALAGALSACLNAGLLWHMLRRQGVWAWPARYGDSIRRMLLVTLLMGLGLVLLAPPAEAWFGWGWYQRLWRLLALCGGGLLTYLAGLRLAGFRLRDFRRHA